MPRRRLRSRKLLDSAAPVVCRANYKLNDAAPEAEGQVDAPVWVQVARAGEYNGYAGGSQSFTFDQTIFDGVVKNFREHPSFQLGPEGKGVADVIAWDFHHASEMPATEGTIPFTGAPAQGWVLDLETRVDANGEVQLWALTRWLEPARTFIREGRYQWASVSVVFDAVDPVSGKVVGPVLTSIALTNQPFIEGMQPLAASKRAAEMQLGRYFREMYFEAADSPENALEMMRKMLGLPETSDAVAVSAELEKVKQWLASGGAPLGVDVEQMVGGMRVIFNMPALSTDEEVLAESDKLIARLLDESGVGDEGSGAQPAPTPNPAPAEPPPAAPALTKENEMLKALAEKLGLQPNEAAVLEEVDKLLELRTVTASALGLSATSSTKVICKAQMSNEEVRAKFSPVLQALGVEDADAALDKVAQLMTDSEELKKAAPELASLRIKQEETEAQEAEADVEEAMASMGIAKDAANYNGIRLAVEHYRKNHKRDEFFERYPKAKPGQSYLTRSVSGQSASEADDPTKVAASRDTESGADVIDVSAYKGDVLLAKTIDYVKSSVSGAANWSWDKLHEHATNLVRHKKVKAA